MRLHEKFDNLLLWIKESNGCFKTWMIFFACLLIITIIYYLVFIITAKDNPFLDLILAIITSFAIAYGFIEYTVNKSDEIRIYSAISALIREMINNSKRLTRECLDEEINNIPDKIKNNQWAGFGKFPSFTNWSNDKNNFYLKYLPMTQYYYLINQGFFGDPRAADINNGIKEKLARIYAIYSRINNKIQEYEDKIQDGKETLANIDFTINYNLILVESMPSWYCSTPTDFLKYSYDTIQQLNSRFPDTENTKELLDLKSRIDKEVNSFKID